MAYKIIDAKFVNDKIKLQSFNLDSSNHLITQLNFQTKAEKKTLTRILKGKEQIKSGRFLVDNMDLVNPSFVKTRASFIKGNNYFGRFIPAKFRLVVTTLLNPKFYRDARIVTMTNKYNYLDFKKSGTNMTIANLKQELEKIISDYVLQERTNSREKIDDFDQRVLAFNERKVTELDQLDDIVLKVVSKSYFDERVRLNRYEETLKFLQALYDNIYNFGNLRNSCTCEYNVKNSSNRELKKYKKELSYQETKYVVAKQLKHLGIRITEMRFKIISQERLVKQLKKQLNMELTKRKKTNSKFNKAQVQSFLNNWNQLIDDQFDIFKQNQQEYLVKTLARNSYIVAKTLVIYIHTYHQKVLSQNINFESKAVFKEQKVIMKGKLISVWKQAVNYNTAQLEEYGMKIDWFLKSTFKMSSLNIVYIRLLQAINLRKKNIILTNSINLLTQNDFKKLMATIEKIKTDNPDFSFLMMQSQIEKFPFLNQPIYMFKKKKFDEASLKNEIDKNYNFFKKNLFNNSGIKYNYDNQWIVINNQKYPYSGSDLKKTGTLFVNPFVFEINFSEPFNNGKINLLVDKKHANNFNDPEMYFTKINNATKFYFYNTSSADISKLNKVWISFSLKEGKGEQV